MAKRRPVSGLDAHVGYWLRFVSNHVSHAFAGKVEEKGVTVAEWVLLRELLDLGPVRPTRLAERLGMTRGTISKLVERLLKKALIERETLASDRRAQHISLTAAGRELVPVLAHLADQNDQEFFGHLDVPARDTLLALLRDIVRRHGWKDLPVD